MRNNARNRTASSRVGLFRLESGSRIFCHQPIVSFVFAVDNFERQVIDSYATAKGIQSIGTDTSAHERCSSTQVEVTEN